jgi:hypothetical protein
MPVEVRNSFFSRARHVFHSVSPFVNESGTAFISGFTGSAGCAVVSMTKAALSTDGRYFNQAAKQLDSNWTLLKRGIEGFLTWQEW